jgi:Homeodomain-like domain-containing protein
MTDLQDAVERWAVTIGQVREHMYRAPTPRERERWHALWLLLRGWSAAQVAEALERDAHTIGQWAAAFQQAGPAGLAFAQTGGTPPPSPRRTRQP